MNLNPIELQIIWNRIIALVDEAAAGLIRTAYSPAVKEYHDFCCALFDADARMIAHSTVTTAGFLGIVPEVMKNFVTEYGAENIRPGDVLITNDPWIASGHLIDISIATPIWHDGVLVGYALCIVHHLDMGGRMATLASTNIYEEGLKIPILKLADEGRFNETVFAFLRANVRVPGKIIGDIRAQIAAVNICQRGACELIEEFRLPDLRTVADHIIGVTEKSLKQKIAKLPKGTFHTVAYLPKIPGCDTEIVLKLAATITDDGVVLDFAGSSGEVDVAINCTLNMTRSYASYPIKLALDPDVPNNHGALSLIEVRAPLGSILNCRPPAATWGRTMISHLLPEIVFGALESVIPEALIGACGGTPSNEMYLHGINARGEPFMTISQHSGGYGGSARQDGTSTLCFPNNTRNTPIEITEIEAALIYRRKEYLPDSAGPGTFRGGFGQLVEFEILPPGGGTDHVDCSVRISGRTSEGVLPIVGRVGGGAGCGGGLWINDAPVEHGLTRRLTPGDRVKFELSGGGGYGDPALRDPGSVAADLRAGLVSTEAIARDYGYGTAQAVTTPVLEVQE